MSHQASLWARLGPLLCEATAALGPACTTQTVHWPQGLLCMWHMESVRDTQCPRHTGWTRCYSQHKGLVQAALHVQPMPQTICAVCNTSSSPCAIGHAHRVLVPHAQQAPGQHVLQAAGTQSWTSCTHMQQRGPAQGTLPE